VGAAAILLLSGAGTLAFWTDSSALDGGSIASGELALSDATCDPGWIYAVGNAQAGAAVTEIVPGDTIAKQCTFTITASGDNLSATLTTPTTTTVDVTSTPAPTTLQLDVSAAYVDQDGAALPATVTAANDGDTVTATLAVAFPFGTETTINANDTQNLAATLDAITVTLVQTEA
jgi:alternate signal-mediated exported protein